MRLFIYAARNSSARMDPPARPLKRARPAEEAFRLMGLSADERMLVILRLPTLLDVYAMCNVNVAMQRWCEKKGVALTWERHNIGANDMRREVAHAAYERLISAARPPLQLYDPFLNVVATLDRGFFRVGAVSIRFRPESPLAARALEALQEEFGTQVVDQGRDTVLLPGQGSVGMRRALYVLLDNGLFYQRMGTEGTGFVRSSICEAPGCGEEAKSMCAACGGKVYCGMDCAMADHAAHRAACNGE